MMNNGLPLCFSKGSLKCTVPEDLFCSATISVSVKVESDCSVESETECCFIDTG